LVIQDGATFSGNVSMGAPVDTFTPIAETPVSRAQSEQPAARPVPAPETPRKTPATRADTKPKGKAKR
jgi:hypothetical protein